MSSRQHECPRCGDSWHCDGCETREVSKLCNSCQESLQKAKSLLSAPYDFDTLVTHVGDAYESDLIPD